MNILAVLLVVVLILGFGCYFNISGNNGENFIMDRQYRMEIIDTLTVYHSENYIPIFVNTIKYLIYNGKIIRKADVGTMFDYISLIIESDKDTVIKIVYNNTGRILLNIPVLYEEQGVYLLYGLTPFKLKDYILQDSIYTTVCNGMYGIKVYKLCLRDEFTNGCSEVLNGQVKINELFYLHYYIKITRLDGKRSSGNEGFCTSERIISIINAITIRKYSY